VSDTNKACNEFLLAVISDLNLAIHLDGNANNIIDEMKSPPWLQCEKNSSKAIQFTKMGYLVVAGLKAKLHGHVAVIVDAPPAAYPVGYWCQLNGDGRKNTTINWSWNHADLKKVEYFAYAW
jgi:hypothetical protein